MAKAKLGNASVRAIAPTEKQFIVWDTTLTGFGVMVNPGGSKTFVLDYTSAGRRRRMTIGRFGKLTVEQAKSQAIIYAAKAELGGDPLQEEKDARAGHKGLTVAALCDQYMKAAEAGKVLKRRSKAPKKPSTLATDRGRIERHIKPLLGRFLVSELTSAQVQQFVDDVTAGKTATTLKSDRPRGLIRVTGGAGTAARTVGLLGGILSWGVRQGVLTSNPAAGVDRAADQKRERRLSPEEYRSLGEALVAAASEPWQALSGIWLLALTGCRLSEISSLKWTSVDFNNQLLVLGDTKTGKSVRPLSQAAATVLSAIPRSDFSPYVLTGIRSENAAYGSLDSAIDRVAKLAQLDGFTAHVMRHSFASVAADLNFSDGTIGSLLGHRAHSVTSRYTHRMDSVLISAATQVASEIKRMMTGSTKNM